MIWSSHYPVLQVVLPLLMAPFIIMLRPARLAWLAATATSLLAFAVSVALVNLVNDSGAMSYPVGGWAAPYGIELRVDSLSAMMLLIVSGASSLALLASYRSLTTEIGEDRLGLFLSAWMLVLAGLSGILVAADAFNIFVFMEIASLASYVLVSGGADRRALPTVFKYLVMGTLGATFYLIGVGLIYIMTGTLNLADMAVRIQDVQDPILFFAAAGFISVGLALKAAIFPLHAWLPNAYTFAPHAVSVFLAACSTKVALYVFFRVDFALFQGNLGHHAEQFSLYLMPMALAAILYGSAMAIREPLVKRLFAWSSIAQIGYIILGVSLLTEASISAALLHMFNHALAKGALFIGIIALAAHTHSLSLQGIAGLGRNHPVIGTAILLAGLSLVGIPGTAGFISKWLLIEAIIEQQRFVIPLLAVVLISSLLAVVYIAKVAEALFFAEAPTTPASSRVSAAALVLLIVVFANVVFGLAPQFPIGLAEQAAQLLLLGSAI
ncbi:MAG: monovalent cation/H+ antiporter subunit D family protein [Proteobacteria bacterium]|nr:monovalent cation/H+ antiporter subunit D family protein [Pseudomonadota bacterium]